MNWSVEVKMAFVEFWNYSKLKGKQYESNLFNKPFIFVTHKQYCNDRRQEFKRLVIML